MKTVFFNETSLNGRFEVMTALELIGEGIRKVGENSIITHKGEIIKDLKHYWVNAEALSSIKSQNQTERSCF